MDYCLHVHPRKEGLIAKLAIWRPCGLCFLLLAVVVGCSGLERLGPADHVVAAPISVRANEVLKHLVLDYGSQDGRWGGCMSDGCVQIWATQFGYRAGRRRNRDDLLELGEVTAARTASDLRGMVWRSLFGKLDTDNPAVFGFPALLVSGTLGDRDLDGFLFEAAITRADSFLGNLGLRERAGLAALLAASAELKPSVGEERLNLARELAEQSEGGGGNTWRLLATAAIARVSGKEQDIELARTVLAGTCYRFDEAGNLLLPFQTSDEVLSRHLSAIHGLVDLVQATGDPRLHRHATTLLDYVFSDAYFSQGLLIHDRTLGQSTDVCSGCNFMALYLVDRLYGDSFVIDPTPQLPAEPAVQVPEVVPEIEKWDTVFTLGAGLPGQPNELNSKLDGLGEKGGFVFQHGQEPVWLKLRYEIGELAGAPMWNLDIHSFYGEESSYSMAVGFDAEGVAHIRVGHDPLLAYLHLRKSERGYAIEIHLFEEEPASAPRR